MCVKQISPYAAFLPPWTREIGAHKCSLFANARQQIAPPPPRLDAIFDSKSGRAFPFLSPFRPFSPLTARVLIFQRVSLIHSL